MNGEKPIAGSTQYFDDRVRIVLGDFFDVHAALRG